MSGATTTSASGIAYLVSNDGTRIGFERLGAGPPLIAVHGSTADRSRWAPVAVRLAERFTVMLMDRRGRGLSGDNPDYALAREIDDVLAVVEARGHQVVDDAELERVEAHLRRGDREAALVTFLVDVVGTDEQTLARLRQAPAWQARLAAAHTYARELRTAQNYLLDAAALATITILVRFLLGATTAPFLRASTIAAHAAIGHSDIAELPGQAHSAIDTAPGLFADSVLGFPAQPAATGARGSGIERA